MFARERLAEKIGLPEARIQVSTHLLQINFILHAPKALGEKCFFLKNMTKKHLSGVKDVGSK